MMRIAKAEARKNFSDVVTRAGRQGERVKITHYGKTLAILINPKELAGLDDCERQRQGRGNGRSESVSARRRQSAVKAAVKASVRRR